MPNINITVTVHILYVFVILQINKLYVCHVYCSEPKRVKCSVCDRRFRNLPALNGHMRLHGGYMKKVVHHCCLLVPRRKEPASSFDEKCINIQELVFNFVGSLEQGNGYYR